MYCTCEATIDDIVFDQGWYYLACKKCFCKIKDPSSKLQCQNYIGEEIGTTQRYKITFKVKDNTGETTFVLFNREAAQLIGVPIDHLINQRKELDSNSVHYLIINPFFNNIYHYIFLYFYNDWVISTNKITKYRIYQCKTFHQLYIISERRVVCFKSKSLHITLKEAMKNTQSLKFRYSNNCQKIHLERRMNKQMIQLNVSALNKFLLSSYQRDQK